MQKLTEKQKRFADYYIELGNATEAAIRAGYSKKSARFTGAENLTKPNISAYITEQMEKKDNQRIMDADEALELLTTIARGELSETVVTPTGKTIQRKADINQRLKALDSLMKRHNVIADVDKKQAEIELIKEKIKQLKGEAKDAGRMSELDREEKQLKIQKLQAEIDRLLKPDQESIVQIKVKLPDDLMDDEHETD